jgi:hypothetical protein
MEDSLRANLKNAIACAAFLFAMASAASAWPMDECRPANPQELQAITKLNTALHDTLATALQVNSWKVDSTGTWFDSSITVATNPAPARPIQICSGVLHVKTSLDPKSPRGAEMNAEAEKLSKEGTDGAKKMFQVLASGQMEIRSIANNPFEQEQLHGTLTKLQVAGVPLAYRVTTAPKTDMDAPDVRTVLCFGNWQNFASDKYVPYPFVHPKGSAYIENVCVTLTTPAETADAVIKQINWQPLNDALTK